MPQASAPKSSLAPISSQAPFQERPVRSTLSSTTRSTPLDNLNSSSLTQSKTRSRTIDERDESEGIKRAKPLSTWPLDDTEAGPNDQLTNFKETNVEYSLLFESPANPKQSIDIVIVELLIDKSDIKTGNSLTMNAMLPSALPEARILQYGVCQVTTADVRISTEKDLLPSLHAKRISCLNRPIIFIGHAFGGIFMEQALIAATKHDLLSIWNSIAGIVFLSTPFSCSDIAQHLLSQQLEKLAGEPRFSSKIKELWYGSKVLKDQEDFVTRVNKAEVPLVCFYEEHSTEIKLEKLQSELPVVGKTHGTMKDFPKVGLSTDFFNVSNFVGTGDRNYKFLLDVILGFVRTRQLLDAAALGRQEVVQSLLDNETNANLQDRSGQTALHKAVRNGQYEMVRMLLGKGGAKIGQTDNEGMTAIHIAVEEGNKDIVLLLLQKGADIKAQNRKRQSAEDLAQSKHYQIPAIKSLLRNRPLIEGPSSKSFYENTKSDLPEVMPQSEIGPCESFQATIAEFYYYNDKEHRVLEQPSVYEVIKGNGPDSILQQTRPRDIKREPICKWYHIPTNNMAWVEGLFTKIGFPRPSSIWAGQKHNSSFPHSRFFRPHCRKVRSLHTETEEELIVFFMPYLSYETASWQSQMAKTIRETHRHDRDMRKFRHMRRLMEQMLRTLFVRRTYQESDGADSEAPASGPQRQVAGKVAQSRKAAAPSESKLEHAMAEPSVYSASDRSDSDRSDSDRSDSDCSDSDCLDPKSSDAESDKDPDQPSKTADVNMIQAYLNHQRPLHVRRTLDQSYYYMLSNTKKRDKDQVVYRHTKRSDKKKGKKDPKIIMVDQLWLWVIPAGGRYESDIVVSSFPQRWRQDPFDKSSLLESILNFPERPPITSGFDLCSLITTRCANIFDRSRAPEDLQLLEIFEISIGKVANKETKLFAKFREASKELSKLSGCHDTRERAKCLDTLLDITKETTLLEEIKDIRDEINMILMILHDQRMVLKTSTSKMKPSNKTKHSDNDVAEAVFIDRYQMVDMNIKDFEKMEDHAKGAHDALNHLLNLKQKQANAWEARFAREGAQEAANQGKTILVFTVVTIIFLPLSFMATFFALSVAQFPKDSSGMTSWQLHHVSGYLFGISVAVSVPFIILAFSVNQMVGLWENHILSWLKNTWQSLSSKSFWKSRSRKRKINLGGKPIEHNRGKYDGPDIEEKKAKRLRRRFNPLRVLKTSDEENRATYV